MERLILIGLAGAAGSLSRYAIQTGMNQALGRPTVLGTMLVNLSGAFLLGILIGVTETRLLPGALRTVASVGFFGAFTTFSALTAESINRTETGATGTAFMNIAASIVLGLVLTYAGLRIGRAVA